MTNRIEFNPSNQEHIVGAAQQMISDLEHVLPKVPWFSNSGQQEAFRKIVQMVTEKAAQVDADDASKEAIVFWVLVLLYGNQKTFRLATASVKNWGTYGITPIASTFLHWVGTNVPPGKVVAEVIGARQALASGAGEKIVNKVLEIARIKGISNEEASKHFQDLLAKSTENFKKLGLSDYEADQKAFKEILDRDITRT